jgi:predicted dehydrogenase
MRFIHVGVGGFGRRWVDVLAADTRAEVVALVDVNAEALAAARDKCGYPESICHDSLEKALDVVQADALVSSTPPKVHRRDVVAGLEAGLHVISEKPMAESLEDCRAMLEAADRTGKLYTVSQNYRYNTPTWTMAEIIRSGTLGRIGQVTVEFFMGVDFGGGFRHEMDYPVLVDMSIHHFDLMRFITGLDPVRVTGHSWNPFWSNYKGDCSSTVLFEMDGGARILYNASWCAKGQFTDWNGSWRIECEKGTLTYHQGEITLYRVPELYKVQGEEKPEPISPPMGGQEYVLDNFITCVETGEVTPTCVQDNIKSIGMVFGAVEAVASGKPTVVFTG